MQASRSKNQRVPVKVDPNIKIPGYIITVMTKTKDRLYIENSKVKRGS